MHGLRHRFRKDGENPQGEQEPRARIRRRDGRSGADLASFEMSGLAGFNLERVLKKSESKVQPAYPGNIPQAALNVT